MTVLEPRPEDDVATLQPWVRSHVAQKLKTLADSLEPQVDGSYGPVNPRMIEVYMKALTEFAKLYRAYDPPKPVEEEVPEVRRAEVLRAQVQAQLDELAARSQITP